MNLNPTPLENLVHPSWVPALKPVEPVLNQIEFKLNRLSDSGVGFAPAPVNVLRAFSRPISEVKVLLIGQDPYPTPGHAVGLSFATSAEVSPLPRSLNNIYRELADDLGVSAAQLPKTGDLTPWFEQGVLLLNRVMTCELGKAGSHRNLGWQSVTDQAVKALVARNQPLVALLWGRDAQQVKPLLGNTPVIESVHPSPLSASRGFFGSKPFSRVNELLVQQGAEPINWLF